MGSYRISSMVFWAFVKLMHLAGFRHGYSMDVARLHDFSDFLATRTKRKRRSFRGYIQQNAGVRIELRSTGWSIFDPEILRVTLKHYRRPENSFYFYGACLFHALLALCLPGKILKFYEDKRFLGYISLSATSKMLLAHTFCSYVRDRNLYQFAVLKAIEAAIANGKGAVSIGVAVTPKIREAKERLGFERIKPAPEGNAGQFQDFEVLATMPQQAPVPVGLRTAA